MATDRPGRSLSLSVRLAATYAMLVAATLLVVAGLVIHLTRRHLAASLDARLASVVASFQTGPAQRVATPADLDTEARRWLRTRGFSPDEQALVQPRGGRPVRSAGGFDPDAVPGLIELLDAPTSGWHDLEAPDGPVRALAVPLELGGRRAGTLVVASRSQVDETLRPIVSGIAVATAVGLAFATVLGVAAVRRTLRPLRRMTAEAEAIEATRDLSRRVEHAGPRDEVGRLAENFDRMLERLEDAFASQRRFLSDASHELRTPLTVMRGQLELLEEGLRGPDAHRSLALANEELERMRRIVDDLLLLARLDEGMPLAREPVEVELVVREALLRGMQLARRESRVDVEPGLYAVADPERLLQALTNLVTNAIRHAGEAATITITGRRREDRVVITVEDDGPGIPPEELPHVFDRLYRGERARAGAPGGAGLGLAIVASLVSAMGGEISAHSTPGEGATFAVVLPAARASEAAETEPIPAV
ncbi:MAG TPA: ATP-binding protein [Actinomycetota bacterium]|nr:ATP-binding protein [Actinomycetota bacterium]